MRRLPELAGGLVVVAVAGSIALLADCSSGDDSSEGSVVDTVAVTATGQDQTLTLTKGGRPVTIEVPANAVPMRGSFTVSLVTGVRRAGVAPATDAVDIKPAGLAFATPVRLRTTVPTAPPRRVYRVVSTQPGADTWTEGAPSRRMPAATDDPASETREWDVGGSGLSALALDDPAPGVGGGTVEDETEVDLGPRDVTVILGSVAGRSTLQVPAGAVPIATHAKVRLLSTLPMATNAPAYAVELSTPAPVTLSPVAKLRQALPPPTVGRSYVAVSATTPTGPWVERGMAKAVTAASTDGSSATSWEIDVGGSGFWGIAVFGGAGGGGGTPDAGAPDAGAGGATGSGGATGTGGAPGVDAGAGASGTGGAAGASVGGSGGIIDGGAGGAIGGAGGGSGGAGGDVGGAGGDLGGAGGGMGAGGAGAGGSAVGGSGGGGGVGGVVTADAGVTVN